ncbi:type II toxin-antitoxin system RelE/ParE family toxin [Jiella marina]|uniref:type II toxin-antitoxin system RelE/ParE family toxin n=1 Tax=Jiella sp. LLJ827 TaxID=2917712 RepID=UPI002101257A|nr:type II toxin-antitoxin system RelE/ParE family toxin [Jiella sp. LLJ827]MCQ0989459.1 type II toxin-antitoxin system RelE/ParE family toxin [Jiella sp. LLJ827]
MRRVEVTYRPEAISDIRQIYRAVLAKSRSRRVAARYAQRIYQRCEKIGDVPLGGRPRDDLRPGLRSVPFEKSALILYQVDESVLIINVFPRGQDYESLFQDRTVPSSK